MPKRLLGLPRVAALAIALIAAALMLLRPLCDSWHGSASSQVSAVERTAMAEGVSAHSGGASVEECCSPGDIGAFFAVRAVSFDRGAGSPSPAPPLVPAALIVLSLVVQSASRRPPLPRTPRSYCLRSTRILR